ncbi:MAG: TetR/AcrR family transcriptional regulator [Pseudomonadales bacterium]
MARRSDHTKEELSELVITNTIELIEEQQSIKVTARQIAERIGYTPGTLYTHFENLDDIFLHVNAHTLAEMRRYLMDQVGATQTGEEALVEMGLAYFEFARRNPHRFQLMFTPRMPRGVPPPAFLQVEIDKLFKLLSERLLAVRPADIAALELGARALWSGVHGAASLALADQLFTDMPNAEPAIVELLIRQFASAWAAQA